MATARYFPHDRTLIADTRFKNPIASCENFLGLPDRVRNLLGLAARDSRLLALSLDQPVTAITSSNKRDLTTRDAIRYARAYFAVISVLADTDNPFPIPQSVHQRRASTFEARPPPRGHYLCVSSAR